MATIKDVAKLAGVSASTASRVLHDNSMISEATKTKVRQAMEELNYSPNYSAQNLVKRDSNMVGIVLPVRENHESLGNNPFFMQIIQGISSVCTDHNFMVSLATGRNESELLKNVETLIRSGNIRRLIFLYAKKDDPVFEAVQREQISCVVVGQPYSEPSPWVTFVDNDNSRAGEDATRFLLEKGYKNLVYAYTDMAELVQSNRFEGYCCAMEKAGLTPKCLHLPRQDGGSNQVRLEEYLSKEVVQGFVIIDDMLALRLQKLLVGLGKVPSDYAMISFNNSLMTELANPSLTSVDVFPYQLGELAARQLVSPNAEQDNLVINHKIIERSSSKGPEAK